MSYGGKETCSTAPLVSIIVPVYNAEAYLPQCVDSILQQSHQDYEVWLIDDGSPDDSPVICEEYARKDERIHVVHQENGGVSSARNTGIDRANGRYLVFIDSDDYVGKDYLKDMVRAAEEQSDMGKNVLILSDYQPFSEDGAEDRTYPEAFCVDMAPGEMTAEQFRNMVFEFRIFPPYCKLYRREIIEENGLRFDLELKSAEDFDFNRRYLEKTDRICYIPSVQYYYRVGYKKYVPSNHGVLGQSEIKSVHIMANGITDLAVQLGLYNELKDDICLWAAKKQYFNRLPMLFAESKAVRLGERYRLYRQLISNPVYHDAYKQGVGATVKSTTRLIGSRFDCFLSWWIFYRINRLR